MEAATHLPKYVYLFGLEVCKLSHCLWQICPMFLTSVFLNNGYGLCAVRRYICAVNTCKMATFIQLSHQMICTPSFRGIKGKQCCLQKPCLAAARLAALTSQAVTCDSPSTNLVHAGASTLLWMLR